MFSLMKWRMYLKYGHNGPQEGVEVFTVARPCLVAVLATEFATEQVHAQDTAPVLPTHTHESPHTHAHTHTHPDSQKDRKERHTLIKIPLSSQTCFVP